jgi:hypothetical protein
MGKMFGYGVITGCPNRPLFQSNSRGYSYQEILWFVTLLIPNTKGWNKNLIEQNFMREEMEIILNIPISPSLPKDRLIWRCTKNGEFSVRSAYHLGLDIQAGMSPSSSSKKDDNEVWKVCWSSNVPPAVKMFVWRACHNLLPTKTNLHRKGVCVEAQCPICLQEEETTEHAVWECPSANDVWGASTIKLQKCQEVGVIFNGSFWRLLRGVAK